MRKRQKYLRAVIGAVVMLSILGSFAGFGTSLLLAASRPELSGLEVVVWLAGGSVSGWIVGLAVALAALWID